MKKPKIRWLTLFIGFFLFLAVSRFCTTHTRDFTIMGISSDFDYMPQYETPSTEEEKNQLREILSQKFTFLNTGGQTFVFLSEDGKHVLKLFKISHRSLPNWARLLPGSYIKGKKQRKDRKLSRDFVGYTIAYNEMRDETKLIAVHINQTKDIQKKVVLVDPIGVEHTLDIDTKVFIVQKRLTPVKDQIDDLCAQGRNDKAQEAVREIIQKVVGRFKRGLYDDDPSVLRNFGFDGDQGAFLDPGRFRKVSRFSDPKVYLPVFKRKIVSNLRAWLHKKHPELIPALEDEIAQLASA